jgi:hypothetical protein
MPAYATQDNLASWIDGDLPANAKAILRSAAYAVREATETAYYAADPTTGLPTDAGVAQAFQDATCAQAAAMIQQNVDPLMGGGSDAQVESAISIGSAHIVYADAALSAESRAQLLGGLCLEASRILRQSGIRLGRPWVNG